MHFLTGSILSLVIPLGLFIAVVVWYVRVWLKESGER